MLDGLQTFIVEVELHTDGELAPTCLVYLERRLCYLQNWLFERVLVKLELHDFDETRDVLILDSSDVAAPLMCMAGIYLFDTLTQISSSNYAQ